MNHRMQCGDFGHLERAIREEIMDPPHFVLICTRAEVSGEDFAVSSRSRSPKDRLGVPHVPCSNLDRTRRSHLHQTQSDSGP